MLLKYFIKLTLLSLLLSHSIGYAKQAKLALVIGNSRYATARLPNPTNDAKALATKLRDLGFEVMQGTDQNQRQMKSLIEKFGQKLQQQKGVGLFFYAGHGIQSQGKNYLIPIGSNIQREANLAYDAIDIGRVLSEMQYAGNNLNIVILDACRNNPLSRSFRSAKRGMARLTNTPTDLLIAYATAPDQVANDGKGRHSPYTQALLNSLNQKGWSIEKVFKETSKTVRATTHGQQIPWISSSIVQDFQFNPSSAETVNRYEDRFWDIVSKTDSCAMYQAYMDEYPQGHYIRLAKIKKKRLCGGTNTVVSNQVKQYQVYNNGTVKDTKTGLMWKHCAEGLSGVDCSIGKAEAYNWNSAVKKFKNISYAGYSDWRLPTIKELNTLVYCSNGYQIKYRRNGYGSIGDCDRGGEDNYQKPTINQQVFPNTSYYYWSSSPDVSISSDAWSVNFKYGYDGSFRRSSEKFVRLVRVGQ